MLKINGLTKTYGGKKAVDDLTLHIAPGEIYGFIGHNGAGKTTTIKSCAGILQFTPVRYTWTVCRSRPTHSSASAAWRTYRITPICTNS